MLLNRIYGYTIAGFSNRRIYMDSTMESTQESVSINNEPLFIKQHHEELANQAWVKYVLYSSVVAVTIVGICVLFS